MTDKDWNDGVRNKVLSRLNQGQSVFLTGGAGSGKSHFLNELVNAIPHSIILAPTGVATQLLNDKYAGINAQTIHSFFKFPLHRENQGSVNMHSYTKKAIRQADAIFIDEVSMVDAARLDSIDSILRNVRENDLPFGGVAVCLVGDLAQLPPVVPTKCSSGISEAEVLKRMGYASPRISDARIWPVFEDNTFELRGSRRINTRLLGRDADNECFYGVLTKLRQRLLGKQVDLNEDLHWLNQHCIQRELTTDFTALASTNESVQQINTRKLAELSSPPMTYHGLIEGEWRNDIARAPLELSLKVGAKVICVMNDPLKQFVNGSMGRVLELGEESIVVAIKDKEVEMEVEITPARWDNWQYQPDENGFTVKSVGHFIQLPVALGYALTVNSAQGLTIDSGVHFLNDRIFNPYLPYVGISRVSDVNSLSLSRPLALH
jgi:ATP-dependent DNA helicase PIF1